MTSADAAPLEAVAQLDAWRVFGVGQDGTLLAPIVARYWADSGSSEWKGTVVEATCIADGHLAPDEACTCGLRGTEDLQSLLFTVSTMSFTGSADTVLADTGVVAKVRLAGRIYPGVNIPDDDPPTTWRAQRATLLELHLAPEHAGKADAVKARYPGLPVITHTGDDWYMAPVVRKVRKGEQAFAVEMKRIGFGNKQIVDGSELLGLGEAMCAAIRKGASLDDLCSVLFDSAAEPSTAQINGLVNAAIECLAPECANAIRGYHFARKINVFEAMRRNMAPLARAFSGS